MTAFPEEGAYPQDYDPVAWRKLGRLIGQLESFACAYSEDYAEGVDDACRAAIGADDLGGTLETDVSFEAKRTRGVIVHGRSDELRGDEINQYTVSSHVRRTALRFKTIPYALLELAKDFGDYDDEDLEDPEVEYGIGFSQQFIIHSSGHCITDFRLTFHIDDDELNIHPDVLAEALTDDEPSAAASASDELFAGIFSGEEMEMLQTVVADAEHESDGRVVLRQFNEQLPAVQNATPARRYDMALQMARQIFTDVA